jgi:hypothetical protein
MDEVNMPDDSELKEATALLWDEARHQIDEQRSTLESLRSRSIALLSVASLVAALFAPHVFEEAHRWWVDVAIPAALVAFALCALIVVWVLAPKHNWEFSQNLGSYFEDIRNKKNVTPEEVTYNLAKDSQASRGRNETKLKCLHKGFRWACVLLGIQVIAWAFANLR